MFQSVRAEKCAGGACREDRVGDRRLWIVAESVLGANDSVSSVLVGPSQNREFDRQSATTGTAG